VRAARVVLLVVLVAATAGLVPPSPANGSPTSALQSEWPPACRDGNKSNAPDGRVGYGSEFRFGADSYPAAGHFVILRREESFTLFMRWKNVSDVTETIEVVPTRLKKSENLRVRYSLDGEKVGRQVRDREVFSFEVEPRGFTGMFQIDVHNDGKRRDDGHFRLIGRYAGAGADECDFGQFDVNRLPGDKS
jgi:hypothetical protein